MNGTASFWNNLSGRTYTSDFFTKLDGESTFVHLVDFHVVPVKVFGDGDNPSHVQRTAEHVLKHTEKPLAI